MFNHDNNLHHYHPNNLHTDHHHHTGHHHHHTDHHHHNSSDIHTLEVYWTNNHFADKSSKIHL